MEDVKGWDKIGHLKPTHSLLLNHVIPRVTSRWYDLGIELFKDSHVPDLVAIKSQNLHDIKQGCTEMLYYWLQTYGNEATWDRLIKALRARGLQLNAFALDIMTDVVKELAGSGSGSAAGVTSTPAMYKNEKLTEKPEIWDLIRIVVPKVRAHWNTLAFSMQYKIPDVEAIAKEGQDLTDRCTKLFQDWLITKRGCTPKTWEKLIERIEEVPDLAAAAEDIKKELLGKQ